ncbi:uncharacterized protein LOC144240067 [Crocuta crocuta]
MGGWMPGPLAATPLQAPPSSSRARTCHQHPFVGGCAGGKDTFQNPKTGNGEAGALAEESEDCPVKFDGTASFQLLWKTETERRTAGRTKVTGSEAGATPRQDARPSGQAEQEFAGAAVLRLQPVGAGMEEEALGKETNPTPPLCPPRTWQRTWGHTP